MKIKDINLKIINKFMSSIWFMKRVIIKHDNHTHSIYQEKNAETIASGSLHVLQYNFSAEETLFKGCKENTVSSKPLAIQYWFFFWTLFFSSKPFHSYLILDWLKNKFHSFFFFTFYKIITILNKYIF